MCLSYGASYIAAAPATYHTLDAAQVKPNEQRATPQSLLKPYMTGGRIMLHILIRHCLEELAYFCVYVFVVKLFFRTIMGFAVFPAYCA
jgi:hypothetical protein